jgi:FMN-dependent oxidoreductase (nitrilotriacetate monooxygenase family)
LPAPHAGISLADVHLNVFTECAPSPQFEGLWRHPEDESAAGYRSLDHWVAVAGKLERACVDALFFADVHGPYDVYRGSWAPAVENAVAIPSLDPVLVLAALVPVTRDLGFAVTFSTTYYPPYVCARVFSTLDHLTGGRVAWNIVTSYLESATLNGIGEYLPHDDRYDRADEYLAVVRALWEDSWQDGAVVRDVERNVYADPSRVSQIDHNGRWFTVRGPHQCEPSPQRTPVLYQAGASDRGMTFAAQHAEVVFFTLGDPRRGAPQVAALRRRAEELGRDPRSVKALQGMPVIVGRTREEAEAKTELFVSLRSAEGMLAKWCGWMGIDLAAHPDGAPLDDIRTEASRSFLDMIKRGDPTRTWTVADLRQILASPPRPHRGGRRMLFGTPDEVVDQMEKWMSLADVDGFNLVPCPPWSGVDDICDLVVPELQRRGLFRTAYDPAERTLRERYFGAGVTRLQAPPVARG